jgi:hypothetical protein
MHWQTTPYFCQFRHTHTAVVFAWAENSAMAIRSLIAGGAALIALAFAGFAGWVFTLFEASAVVAPPVLRQVRTPCWLRLSSEVIDVSQSPGKPKEPA